MARSGTPPRGGSGSPSRSEERSRAASTPAIVASLRNWVMPPMRGASGWTMSAAPASMRRMCSATLASISPVAIGVSRERARLACPRRRRRPAAPRSRRARTPRRCDPSVACGAIPLLVGVHHQRHVIVEELAHLAHPCHIGTPVRLADLELDTADASSDAAALSRTCSIGVEAA